MIECQFVLSNAMHVNVCKDQAVSRVCQRSYISTQPLINEDAALWHHKEL